MADAFEDYADRLVASQVARDDRWPCGVGQVFVTPLQEGQEDWAEVGTAFGELVLVPAAAAWVLVGDSFEDACADQAVQAGRQEVAGDA
jgi:hypothetical protein